MIKKDTDIPFRDILICVFTLILLKVLGDTGDETLLGMAVIPFVFLFMTGAEDFKTAFLYYVMLFLFCFGFHMMSEAWGPLRGFRYIR